MARAVLFDLGNVLVQFSHTRMVRQVASCLGCSDEALKGLFFRDGLLWQYERGLIDTEALHRELCAWAGRQVPLDQLVRAASDIFWPNPPMESLALELLARDVPIVVVSNTCPIHVAWIEEHFPFFRKLARRVLSFEVGAAKPERTMFEAALRRLGDPSPSEVLYFDDTVEHVEAARKLGIQAHRYTDPEGARAIIRRAGLLQ